jgi:hypothetical protein
MIWALTISVFLVTAVAVLLIFSVLSSTPTERRIERRTSAQFDVDLYGLDEPLAHEMACTENVSRRGARVVTKKPWQRNNRVVIKLPQGNERSRAKVAYCNALPKDGFAVGLKLSKAFDGWLISTSGMWDYDISPFRK